ncbi:MAG: M23 family metallopeptidase [bacterium]
MFQRMNRSTALPPIRERFGIRGPPQVCHDLCHLVTRRFAGGGFELDPSSLGLVRPDLSWPAYLGLVPSDGVAPIFNLFDRVNGGKTYRNRVTRRACRDFRGGRLTYDDHDGTDFVIPIGTVLGAAAPGVLVSVRDRWLRGGLTATVDHGEGVTTQYSHLCRVIARIGQPLARGDTVGLSGASGVDMTSLFPWVPPHLHFMLWHHGRPVDPFAPPPGETGEESWWAGDAATTASGTRPDDPPPPTLHDVVLDPGALDALIAQCGDKDVRVELARTLHEPTRLAICEDSLHHERYAWPAGLDPRPLRPLSRPPTVRISLPLPHATYRSARPADTPWTRPRPGRV